MARASGVAVVSRATAEDIARIFGNAGVRPEIVACGVDDQVFYRRRPDDVMTVRKKFGIRGPYVIFVGLTHAHKRFSWLLQHFVESRATLPAGSTLVAVGGYAERDEDAARVLAQNGSPDSVIFTGRVSDADLAALYSGASAYVTASLNEGNNLPPLEALACGCKVIATAIIPLRDALGDEAFYYDPADGASFVDLTSKALAGHLSIITLSFSPPTWRSSAEALARLLARASARWASV